jgi:MSHA pilin protein MshC
VRLWTLSSNFSPGGAFATKGFTLVELVVILLIMSVLAFAAIPRLTDTRGFDARGFHDELISAVRYGQKVAVASGCEVEVQLSASGYALVYAGECSGPVQHPATRSPLTGTAPSGVPIAGNSFRFDGRGALVGGLDRSVSVGGGENLRSFVVIADTGYVVSQ